MWLTQLSSLRRVFHGHDHDYHYHYHEEGSIHYIYNERDERTIKHVHDEEIVYVNSLYVVKNHGIVTKNVMADSSHLVSKVHHRHHHPDSDVQRVTNVAGGRDRLVIASTRSMSTACACSTVCGQ